MISTSLIIFIAFAALVLFMVFNFRKMKSAPVVPDSDKIKTLTDQNFDHQVKKGVTLVDFWASWCMPCKMMAPILNDLSENLDDKASIAKLNVDDHRGASAKYGVRSIPTMVLFKNGKEVNRFVGVKSKEFLMKEILKVQ